jgi:hypothetical protein
MYTQSLSKTASWVIVDLLSNQPVLETFSKQVADAINTNRYKAVPILEWLQSLNRKA